MNLKPSIAELLKRTNAHELLPPAAGESNTALPGATVVEVPAKRSTSDPLEANFAEVDMLSSLSRKTRPSWLWWMALVLGGLPSVLAVPAWIYFGWASQAFARAGGYAALHWSLVMALVVLIAAAWTYALFRRKPG